METATLNQIHEDMVGIKKELEEIKSILEEDPKLSTDLSAEIELSRKRPKKDFISHEEMKKEFL